MANVHETGTETMERPIIFSGPMVCAILDGRKSQTRRVVTRANSLFDGHAGIRKDFWAELDWSDAFVDEGPSPAGNPGPYLKVARPSQGTRHRIYPRLFPTERRELFWVRETWWHDEPFHVDCSAAVKFCASDDDPTNDNPMENWVKRSARHMPKWAARIWLEVTRVRVQRVQEISEADATAEGFVFRSAFRAFWDSLNARRGHGWDKNDWVWVYEFARTSRGAAE